MHPVNFSEANVVIAANQPPYYPLPALYLGGPMGICITCFELTEDEIAELINTRKLWVTMLTFKQPFQPFSMNVEKPFLEVEEPPLQKNSKPANGKR